MRYMNLQGGDNDIPKEFYELTFSYVKDGASVLNLGCGSRFNFERSLSKIKDVDITSVDIIDIKEKPKFIEKFLKKSVEENIHFESKFDVVTLFELIEHIDKTDILLKNCFNNLKDDGILILSFPNLASIYSRFELMLGFQPHILEVSNEQANFGAGIFGRLNNRGNQPIHHIRGITHRAMKEMLEFNGFEIIKVIGYEWRLKKLFYYFPSIAPVNIFICLKK